MGKRKSEPYVAPVAAAAAPVTPLPDPEGASVQSKIKAARDAARTRMSSAGYGGKRTGAPGAVKTVKPVATGSALSPLGG